MRGVDMPKLGADWHIHNLGVGMAFGSAAEGRIFCSGFSTGSRRFDSTTCGIKVQVAQVHVGTRAAAVDAGIQIGSDVRRQPSADACDRATSTGERIACARFLSRQRTGGIALVCSYDRSRVRKLGLSSSIASGDRVRPGRPNRSARCRASVGGPGQGHSRARCLASPIRRIRTGCDAAR
jgi:hypothetical protein